jgi:sucrose phosphorylase
LPLTEKDALLITYGDQIRQTGIPPLQALDVFTQKYLKGVVSGIHLLPFYPSSSDDGFAVEDWFSIDPALGDWRDVERLGKTFQLMFDGVFNHLSAGNDWFRRFLADEPEYQDFFITVQGEPDLSQVVRPRALPLLTKFESSTGPRDVWTTFSADQVDLNFKNPEVLLRTLEALLFYVERGARFMRLDAIAYLWKEIGTSCIHLSQTHRVIQLMRAVLDEVAPEVFLITETNVPHADNLSYFGDGRNEAQLIYNFALPPLVLHSLTTANGDALTRWAASLELPSDAVTFFNFLASHDGIGINPARNILRAEEIEALVQRAQAHGGFVSYKANPDGSNSPYELNINFFDALSNPSQTSELGIAEDRFMAAQAIMLALRGLPGIYFHSLFGSRNDRAAAEASGIPRRINREKLDWSDLEEALSDSSSLRARVFARFKKLLQARRTQASFAPTAGQNVLTVDSRVFGLVREARGAQERVLCLHNLTKEPVSLRLGEGFGLNGNWIELLTGRRYSLTGEAPVIELEPYQVFWARST